MRVLLIIGVCLLTNVLAGPVTSGDSERVWGIAEQLLRDEHKGDIHRIKRAVREYDNFGGLGAIMEFADSVDKKVELTCSACKAAAESARYFLAQGYSEAELLDLLHAICMDFEIMTQGVCDGFTKNVGPEIVVVLNTTALSPLQICSFLVGDQCGEVDNPHNDWVVPLPPVTKPPVQLPELPPSGTKTLKVLHLSDTHIDIKYAEGSSSVCQEPLCCRADSTPLGDGGNPAGKWGDWKCDTPMITFDNMLEQASKTHKDLDYIIWTGDLPAHDLWDQTQNSTLDILRNTAGKVKAAFPDIPLYPALGNHDSAPVNSFPQPEVGGKWNISWLYDELVDVWQADFLSGSDEATQTIRKGAFYSTLAKPGLRIISLNMNYCYLSNWWLIVNSTDPAQELAWLTEELQKAEYAGEKVHIIGHIPPGHTDCLETWSRIYAQLITRYESTVVAQFFGHTHKDEFEVYYDVADTSRPVAVSYVGPSITSYTDLNPGYRIYYVDGAREDATGLVTDHETWIFDLDEANTNGEPNWRKSYTMLEEYGMGSLLPSDFDTLYQKLASDNDTFALYTKHYYKESPVGGKCDEDCKKGRLCAIKSCMLYGEPEW